MCLVGNIRLKSRSMEGKHDVMKNESSELELWLFKVPWLLSGAYNIRRLYAPAAIKSLRKLANQ